ncbi:MAG: FAD-dependent oxidoreductase [Ruminococcaceae bacterium]|nr:FAD-dependent oxidoreductase [Oscillospiraceae bacterium]
MDSIWMNGIQMPHFPPLQGDLHTDVLVIGGGLAGLLCAHRLTCAGINCTLIEQNRLMQGISGRTTAKLTSQHGPVYARLLETLGPERARLYWQANQTALTALCAVAEKAECDLSPHSCYLYSTDGTQSLEREMVAYEQLQIPYRWVNALPLPFSVSGALAFDHQAQFHPMKLASHIARGLNIFENTKAVSFVKNRVQTPMGTICAEKIVIATHFPLLNKHGAYFLKLYQQRSYVIALENAPQTEGMYLDCAENGLSIRSAGPWLLLGGGGHRTGKKGLGWTLPEAVAKRYYPQAHIAARWATQDCMSLDAMPYIGSYSKSTPDLYVATGFQKWGMSSAMLSALLLCDLICGRDNPYAALFSPSRSILHKQLLYNGADAVLNLLRPTRPRCPHMGCALQWNRAERSWDCPCHGSRFDRKGQVLNNPATDDLRRPPRA